MTDLELLESIRTGYLTALYLDSQNPKPDYSIDGQTVSRAQWRADLMARVEQIGTIEQHLEPYELRGNAL